MNFNPRSPRGERPFGKLHPLRQPGFQSTLPSRGATSAQKLPFRGYRNFNPRSPRGERPGIQALSVFSPQFQSTLPSRGATVDLLGLGGGALISIHAPLAGSDSALPFRAYALIIFQSTLPSRGATGTSGNHTHHRHFNPRSPRGERPAPPPH